jgi:hypothetical protein
MKILALSKLCHKEKSASQKEEWNLDYQEHNNRTHTHKKIAQKHTHTNTHTKTHRTGFECNYPSWVGSVEVSNLATRFNNCFNFRKPPLANHSRWSKSKQVHWYRMVMYPTCCDRISQQWYMHLEPDVAWRSVPSGYVYTVNDGLRCIFIPRPV